MGCCLSPAGPGDGIPSEVALGLTVLPVPTWVSGQHREGWLTFSGVLLLIHFWSYCVP